MAVTKAAYLDTLAEIARIATQATQGYIPAPAKPPNGLPDSEASSNAKSCQIKHLPARLHDRAARVAARTNPVNAPFREVVPPSAGVAVPARLVVMTTKYWGPAARQFTVSFTDNPEPALRTRILGHMNAWSLTTGMSFVETNGVGNVRISRATGGYWSYLGTDILSIPAARQTMNLEGFTMNTPDSEFYRVVRHETGHTLGFPHEHMRRELVARIDPVKAYPYFLQHYGWDKAMVDAQVLTPLGETTIFGTPPDQDSIMCYQLEGAITVDGQPIRGGLDINPSDAAFAGTIYPKVGASPAGAAPADPDDWDPSEDPDE